MLLMLIPFLRAM